MRHPISISDETLARLKALAEPFVDREPEDVIRRLLDDHERARNKTRVSGDSKVSEAIPRVRLVAGRAPRERGVMVQIGDQKFDAVSVRDLYQQVLEFLVEHHKSKLQAVLPLKTSRERYLVALEPIHPSGNRFIIPVEFHGFYMEAHKDYQNAIRHLIFLTAKLDLQLMYLG